MSDLDWFILNNNLTSGEIEHLRAQCSGADEYHDIERALAQYRGRA